MWRRLVDIANEPTDPRGLAVFRMLFGATMCVGALRFLANGWVDRFFVQPSHHLSYWGLGWVEVASPIAMHAVLWAIAAFAAMIAIGAFYRVAVVGFVVLFCYVELIDVSNYLNHYVLATMLALVLLFVPAHAVWSVDAWRKRRGARMSVPRIAYSVLRFQVGAVWVSAAVAKMTSDWLVHAQPMNIWLAARVETPIIGSVLDIWEVALVASWAGLLYDLTIPFLLLWRRTRTLAFVAVVGFHFATFVWFPIGMFPLIMIVCATVFFAPDWPSRFFKSAASTLTPGPGAPRWAVPLALSWCAVLMVLPLRFIAYGGDVLWHEQGMRWGFKVMCREKNGAVTYRVRLPSVNRAFDWAPRTWLTPHQEREMSGQPDVILRLGHEVADHYRGLGHDDVEVYVDAISSLNGRPPARLIDPDVNLTELTDGVAPASWILPAPTQPPPKIGRRLNHVPSLLALR